jgi:hypothetical protein
MALLAAYKKELANLETQIQRSTPSSNLSVADLLVSRNELRDKRLALEASIAERRKDLGIQENAQLRTMLSSDFLQARLNARALKERIRVKVVSRKFEMERLEKATNSTSGERSLQTHIQSQVQRHQPNIVKLMNRYNTLCMEMERLIGAKKAPPGSLVPKQLVRESLFSLDVDDGIWNDAGLGDDDVPPLWMSDDAVRGGIQSLLAFQRCLEEEECLKVEYGNLRRWMNVEWMQLCEGLIKCRMSLFILHDFIYFNVLTYP